MANIYVEQKGPQGPQFKESLLPTAVAGYSRGLAVKYGADQNTAILIAAAASPALGILEEDAININQPSAVVEFGSVIAQIGANVARGQGLTTDGNGRLVPALATNPVVAMAMEDQNYVAPGSFACVFFFGAIGVAAPWKLS